VAAEWWERGQFRGKTHFNGGRKEPDRRERTKGVGFYLKSPILWGRCKNDKKIPTQALKEGKKYTSQDVQED